METIFVYIGYGYVTWLLLFAFPTGVKIIWNFVTQLRHDRPVTLTEKYGSWAVVTGSTDGIGKAYTRQLAKRGLNIVLISRNTKKLETVAKEIETDFNVKTKIITCDFSNGPSVYKHIEAELVDIPVGILGMFGTRASSRFNNVGMVSALPCYLDETPLEMQWHMIHVNVTSTLMMTTLLLPEMKRRRKGAIVNVSSASENVPLPYFALYSACKAFLKNLTLLLQFETRNYGITVQLLSPGFVKTNMVERVRSIPFPKFVYPDSETYAMSAIKTLGYREHTTGYWFHELSAWYINLFSMKTKIRLFGWVLAPIRHKYKRQRQRQLNSIATKSMPDNNCESRI